MKKIILTIVISVVANFVSAGNGDDAKYAVSTKLVAGKVIDKVSGEEIAGAAIKIADKVYYSDLNGNFSALVETVKTEATVNSISYNESKINIDPFSYEQITIELESK